MDWSGVIARVTLEACNATEQDIVLYCGPVAGADALAARVGSLVRAPDLRTPPPGVSVVCLHQWLRRCTPTAQQAVFHRAAALLPERGLLVVGDVMWSFPADQIDDPEQFGDDLEFVQTTATIERWARDAGFLPDLHRFGAGVGVLLALRGPR